MNAAWHTAHVLGRGATQAQRIAWHVAHAKACGCREVPGTIQKLLVGKRLRTCSRGHAYLGGGACPVCWPGGVKGRKRGE